jgi:hypothetical protein
VEGLVENTGCTLISLGFSVRIERTRLRRLEGEEVVKIRRM